MSEDMNLQARCLAVGQTLMGSYLIPATVDVPLDLAVNPWGVEERSRKFVWNDGDKRRKLITLANKADRQKRGHLAPGGGIHEGAAWADGNGRLIGRTQPTGKSLPPFTLINVCMLGASIESNQTGDGHLAGKRVSLFLSYA